MAFVSTRFLLCERMVKAQQHLAKGAPPPLLKLKKRRRVPDTFFGRCVFWESPGLSISTIYIYIYIHIHIFVPFFFFGFEPERSWKLAIPYEASLNKCWFLQASKVPMRVS